MSFSLSPKIKRNISRILPFGIIWLIAGWAILLIEGLATNYENPDPETAITLTLSVFLFASFAVMVVGLIVGTIEIIWLEKVFRKRSFAQKLFYKLILYTLLMLVIISVTYPIAAGLELGISPLDGEVWAKFLHYLNSRTFASTLFSMSISLFLCFFYAGISENLGHKVLINFFTGKYHSPKVEKRIFMFLDMKSSTTVAEKLGHIRYFDFLREYYDDLSEGIIAHQGEVYQYIGDEVVVSWKFEAGLAENNCLKCFFAMKNDLEKRWDFYRKKFDFEPQFKVAMHFGEVTTGEIGALKKEIFYTGDVLNTTSRIQGLCNYYGEDLLISEALYQHLDLNQMYTAKPLGTAELKGKEGATSIVAIRA